MLNCLFFRIFPPFVLSGCGLLPANSIWQGAGGPATSQMRCWLLRRHKLHIPRPAASGRSRPFRCASSQNRNRVAGLRFGVFLRTSAQRWLFPLRRTHTRCRGRKPHTAATRASRCAPGVRHTRRVDRVDFLHGGKIGTFGTSERDQPLSIAAVGLDQNSVFP